MTDLPRETIEGLKGLSNPFDVIIAYDIDSDNEDFYKLIHEPLSIVLECEMITKSVYKLPNQMSQREIDEMKKSIIDQFNSVTTTKFDTSVVKLIVAQGNILSIQKLV